ncbi:MAG TPA: sigma-54 dependent transcriptional regulator [Clostridia bacterium]|nr:sigma-54 dependent transcriptional regulator [Clostridia bacterium]
MSTILIIDDEPGIRTVLTDILEDENYRVLSAADGLEGMDIIRNDSVDLVILDVWLPHKGGIDVLKEIKELYPDLNVVVISGHANIDMAVKAVKNGAFDFLEKPLSLDKVITLVGNSLELRDLKQENKQLRASLFQEDDMIGSSPQMEAIWERIHQSAASDAKVLITGENGTGKELVAREIHRRSRRAEAPFVEVNCAAIPDTLLESELFGHERGAFTSAVSRRKGKFEIAHGGTLFLDEIADMTLSAQAKVLRAIQEQQFERVGGEKSIQVDIRLLTATNKNIEEEIAAGRFREDLFFRLNVVPIPVPPLRERVEDLPLLVSYFMHKYNPLPDQPPRSFTSEAMKSLQRYSWPGNIRELKNFIERINIMTDEPEISAELVSHFLQEKKIQKVPQGLQKYSEMQLNEAKADFERTLLEQRLEQCDYNISRTAQDLGIYPSNLHGKIKKYGIKTKK